MTTVANDRSATGVAGAVGDPTAVPTGNDTAARRWAGALVSGVRLDAAVDGQLRRSGGGTGAW